MFSDTHACTHWQYILTYIHRSRAHSCSSFVFFLATMPSSAQCLGLTLCLGIIPGVIGVSHEVPGFSLGSAVCKAIAFPTHYTITSVLTAELRASWHLLPCLSLILECLPGGCISFGLLWKVCSTLCVTSLLCSSLLFPLLPQILENSIPWSQQGDRTISGFLWGVRVLGCYRQPTIFIWALP